jgi:hypothetical protein
MISVVVVVVAKNDPAVPFVICTAQNGTLV